jgi:hypothetical protein
MPRILPHAEYRVERLARDADHSYQIVFFYGGGPDRLVTQRGRGCRYRRHAMDVLTARGRAVRVLVTVLGAALLLAGTLWGQDDHFPFGPFRMYATSSDPDQPAPDTRVEGVDAAGAVEVLTERNSGIRRAEIEGQQGRYAAEPALLAEVAQAYADRNPGAADLVEVRIVIRWHGIRDSRPTGDYVDETVVRWRAP